MSLLERGFPVAVINDYSEVEKGPGRPPHWEMVFWWTRKPLAGARAVIAASLLTEEDVKALGGSFLDLLFPCRGGRKTVHTCNPSPRLVERLRGKRLLDPFAGFGSIPLEALRLGLDATAVELLPTAYVFLKAVLEYPKWAAEKRVDLAKEVEKWGRWVVERLREDPDVEGLYGDAAVYIGTWEVKCPACGRYTPLVGNWWLARVKKGNEYERLAWMEWNNGVRVVDLGRARAEVKARGEEGEGGVVKAGGREYRVPAKNIDARRETARCLYCGAEINHRVVGERVIKPSAKKKVGDWYVKWALRQWNERYERYLRGEITLEELKGSPARPTLLVKVRLEGKDLRFEPADNQDVEKLWKAAEKLKEMWGDPDIPAEEMWKYTSGSAGNLSIIVWGFDRFYKLFNPRQLLTLVKLVKLIREAGRLAEEEKLREGWGREDAHKYAEAVTTYLAMWLVNFVRYNNVVTHWQDSYWGLLKVKHALAFRGIAITWSWCEFQPIMGLEVFQPYTIDGLAYLVSAVSGSPGRVRVLLDDAASLSKLEGEVFDVVVTDPPYADDVPYAELSDFYYVWLKRALSGVEGGRLVPRFLSEAFFDEFGEEITTQWQFFAPREVSENEGRFEYFKMREGFADLLARAFSNVLRFLKPEGLLVVYYVAKKPESWVSLVKALWEVNGLEMVAAHPVATESEESVVARGKAAVLGGYVSAWRKSSGGPLDLDSVDTASEVAKRVEEYLRNLSEECVKKTGKLLEEGATPLCKPANGATAWVYSYMAALSYLTAHREVYKGGVKLDAKGVVEEAVSLAFRALLKTVEVPDLASKAYLALKILAADAGKVDSDALAHVERALGVKTMQLIQMGLIRSVEAGGPKVAARKVFEVVAPAKETVEELQRVLSLQKRASPVLICFRQLQLHLAAKASVMCSPQDIEDALSLTRAINRLAELGILGEEDVDASLAGKILRVRWT